MAVIEDKDGYLWFGDHRFDGTNLLDYGIGVVEDVAMDSNGNLWFAIGCEGVAVLAYGSGERLHYDLTHMGLNFNHCCRAIAVDPNTDVVWIGADVGQVAKWDGSSWSVIDLGNRYHGVHDIDIDSEGTAWLAASERAYSIRDGELNRYGMSEGLISTANVDAVLVDRNDDVWFGTRVGLSKFDGQAWASWTVLRFINSIAEDHGGHIWVSGAQLLLSFDGTEWYDHTDDVPFAGSGSGTIYVDRQGNVWFKTGASYVSTYYR